MGARCTRPTVDLHKILSMTPTCPKCEREMKLESDCEHYQAGYHLCCYPHRYSCKDCPGKPVEKVEPKVCPTCKICPTCGEGKKETIVGQIKSLAFCGRCTGLFAPNLGHTCPELAEERVRIEPLDH